MSQFSLGTNVRGCHSPSFGRSALLVQLPALRSAARRAVGRCRAMASTGGPSEAQAGASAAVSTSCNISKLKRTPVILNPPRKPPGAHFKVLQWNVLADGLAQNGDFCRVHPDHLEWEYRKPLLLQEIMEANADIICLQELNHFEDLSQVLKELGYEGAFREKHASPALKYEYPPDGMAVFYRSGRFTCSAGAVEGRSFQDDCTGREQSQGYLQILLHDLLVGRDLLVVTTHLKAKDGAECEDMRYQQAKQLLRNVSGTLERLEKTSQEAAAAAGGNGSAGSAAHGGGNGSSSSKAGGNGSSNGAGPNGSGSGHAAGGAAAEREHLVPVVVTGDFNTLPGSKTCRAFREHPLGLMSLWEQRPIDATLSSGSDMDMPPPPPPPAPAAAGSSGAGGAAAAAAEAAAPTLPSEFSTWKFRVKGESKRISDYIYFSGGGLLRPLQRWRMLTEAEIGPTALPSPAYASDHVSLCCEFEWDVDADLEWAPRSREPDWG